MACCQAYAVATLSGRLQAKTAWSVQHTYRADGTQLPGSQGCSWISLPYGSPPSPFHERAFPIAMYHHDKEALGPGIGRTVEEEVIRRNNLCAQNVAVLCLPPISLPSSFRYVLTSSMLPHILYFFDGWFVVVNLPRFVIDTKMDLLQTVVLPNVPSPISHTCHFHSRHKGV